MNVEIVKVVLEYVSAKSARSTVLHPLQWFAVIAMSGTIGTVLCKADFFIVRLFALTFVGTCALGGVAYVYFSLKDPNALRSERYLLSKLSLENERLIQERSNQNSFFQSECIEELPSRERSIQLGHVPISETVRLIVDGTVYMPKAGYRTEGRQLIFENQQLLEKVAAQTSDREVTVEYRYEKKE